LKIVADMMKDRRWPGFIREIELFTNEKEVMVNVVDTEGGQRVARSFFDWCAAKMKGGSAGHLDYPAGGGTFRVSHGSFFQVNRFLIEKLTEAALEGVEGTSALELYCGVGLFTVPLARRFAAVTGVESSVGAVRDLEFNAQKGGVKLKGERANAEQFLANVTEAPDFVLADPPRAGLGPAVTQHLIRLMPAKLTIVACDPATLARDVSKLVGAGYHVEAMTLVDLFPQTYHIECVVRLSR
jgi:23S rRNA (uracil1939-C5)-methyltransferase